MRNLERSFMKKQTRSEARIEVFSLIFQTVNPQEDLNEKIDLLLEEKPECEANLGYIKSVAGGICEKCDELYEHIEKHLKKGWSLKRIPKITRNVLMLAIYEILYVSDVPTGVAINEAVEIAKVYGDEEQGKFVNGLLGNFVKEL